MAKLSIHLAVLASICWTSCAAPLTEASGALSPQNPLRKVGTDGLAEPPASAVRQRLAPRLDPAARLDSARVRVPEPVLTSGLQGAMVSGLSFRRADGSGGLVELLTTLRAASGTPILLTPAAREVVEAESPAIDLDIVAPMRLVDLLDLIAAQSERLRWRARDGVVYLDGTESEADALPVRHYDVRALTFARTEFVAPVIHGIPTGEEEGPRSGVESEERVATYEPDTLVETLRVATGPEYWARSPNASLEVTASGVLVARASMEMHRKIARWIGL